MLCIEYSDCVQILQVRETHVGEGDMTNLIDIYLLKSGMPAEELCVIGRTKRALYYYGMLALGALGLSFMTIGLYNIFS